MEEGQMSQEHNSLLLEYNEYRSQGGYFQLESAVLEMKGADCIDFLHRLTTQDVKNLSDGHGAPAALLDSTGTIISLFDLYRSTSKHFWIVVDQGHASTTLEQLEKLHFAEDFEIANLSSEWMALSLQGEKTDTLLSDKIPWEMHSLREIPAELLGSKLWAARESDFSSPGFHLFLKPDDLRVVEKSLNDRGFKQFSRALWSALRLEAHRPQWGVDITEKNMILEAPLEGSVARNKGCYPGQEVVERVFTYGNIGKKLVGVRVHMGQAAGASGALNSESLSAKFPPGTKLLVDGKEAGVLTSLARIPWNGEIFGYALMRKPHFEAGQKTQTADGINAEVVSLPLGFEIQRELKKL
jgi:folate-binding protein YgfZ